MAPHSSQLSNHNIHIHIQFFFSPKHCPQTCSFPCENWSQCPSSPTKFPTLIASVLWKGALPTAGTNRVKAELRSRSDMQKGDLSGHKLFLEALLNPRAGSDLTSYVNRPTVSSLFLMLFSGTSAVSGYLFKWAFFTWSGLGLALQKKKKKVAPL